MPSRSLTVRTSLLFTLLAAGVFLVMGTFIRASVQHHFGEQDRFALEGKLELIRHILEGAHTPADRERATGRLEDALIGHHDLSVRVRDAQGRVLLSRTLQPGEVVGLDGEAPLRLVVGNAASTEVVFRGQPVPLGPHTRDTVARLELK